MSENATSKSKENELPYYPVKPELQAKAATGASITVIGIDKARPMTHVYANTPNYDQVPLSIASIRGLDPEKLDKVREKFLRLTTHRGDLLPQ
ncbi:MAG: hypothetical protein KW788_03355 [Candidatus Doudnabacteria bacterium]|nr:hypothetical protein [Candidatus Doudnabacteria bacterium]